MITTIDGVTLKKGQKCWIIGGTKGKFKPVRDVCYGDEVEGCQLYYQKCVCKIQCDLMNKDKI
jgi:hypothetical protein